MISYLEQLHILQIPASHHQQVYMSPVQVYNNWVKMKSSNSLKVGKETSLMPDP